MKALTTMTFIIYFTVAMYHDFKLGYQDITGNCFITCLHDCPTAVMSPTE